MRVSYKIKTKILLILTIKYSNYNFIKKKIESLFKYLIIKNNFFLTFFFSKRDHPIKTNSRQLCEKIYNEDHILGQKFILYIQDYV